MTLAVNQLIGFGAFEGESGVVAATKTYRGSQVDNVDRTTYNAFSTITVDSDDTFIYIAVGWLAGASINLSSSSTIVGNVSGSRTITRFTVNSATGTAGIYADISGDTSVTITPILSAGATCCAIAAWSGAGAVLPALDTDTDGSNPFDYIGDAVPDGGLGFGCAINSNTTPPSASWSNWTKDEDISLEGGQVFSVGSVVGPASEPTVTYSPSTAGSGAWAVFNPG